MTGIDIPEQPSAAELRTLDLCSMVDADEAARIWDAEIVPVQYQFTFDSCEVGPFEVNLPSGDFRNDDSHEGSGGTRKVSGGTILTSDVPPGTLCGRDALTTDGFLFRVFGWDPSEDDPEALCAQVEELTVLALTGSAELARFEHPQGSLALLDLCTFLADGKYGELIGGTEDVVPLTSSRRSCQQEGTVIENVTVSIGLSAGDSVLADSAASTGEEVTVGKRRAVLESNHVDDTSPYQGCNLIVLFDENPAISARWATKGKTGPAMETLTITAQLDGEKDCDRVLDVAEDMVAALGT